MTQTAVKKNIPLKSLFFVNDILSSYYRMLRKIKSSKIPVAYVTLGFPKHFFYSMGIVPVYPQYHAGFQSARGKAKKNLKYVEDNYEIPHDICGEVKATIGTALNGDGLAFNMPKPDMIVANNSYCSQGAKGFKFLAEKLSIPYYFWDFPCISGQDDMTHYQTYAMSQLNSLAEEIQKEFHTKFDYSKLASGLKKDHMSFIVWTEILKLCSATPAPVDAMDLNIFLLPFHIIDPENDDVLNLMIDLYNSLYKASMEYKETSEKEIRLLWDFLPVYHKKDYLKELFSQYNAVVVISTYFFGSTYYIRNLDLKFEYPITKEKVIDYVAERPPFNIEDGLRFFLKSDAKQPLAQKKEKIKDLIKDFKIDAVVLHMDRSCRPISLPQYELMDYIEKELKTPVLLFDADSMDERYFSKSQIATRVEAFMENLPSKIQNKN